MGVLLLALVSCGWEGTGTVVGNGYNAPHTVTHYDTVCMYRNTNGTCSASTIVPRQVHHSAKWSLRVEDQKDGKRHWVTVSEYTFNQHPIGSTFTNGDGK
jgi:hypothetical protein